MHTYKRGSYAASGLILPVFKCTVGESGGGKPSTDGRFSPMVSRTVHASAIDPPATANPLPGTVRAAGLWGAMKAQNTTATAAPGSFTDQKEGFPRLRARFEKQSPENLCKQYLENSRHCLHGLFCQNMQREQDVLAGILIAKGVREIPNSFGAIRVRADWSKLGPAHR